MCVRDSYVYQKMFFVVLFMKVMSGRLEGIVLSVIIIIIIIITSFVRKVLRLSL
jgi:hypothetical protein